MPDAAGPSRSILVVDDDCLAAQSMSLALQGKFPEVSTTSSAAEALDSIRRHPPSLVISDLRMPDMDGLWLLSRIQESWPEIRFILVTVEDNVATAVEAILRGARDYLVKPVSPETLCETARRALSQSEPSESSPRAAAEILGDSPGMVRARRKIVEAAQTGLNVLIVGETGTGKELAARAIHHLSRRSSAPFVAQNCAAIPADLLESQFFGHRRGAFTGAERDHQGLLEEADGGTLFLDELECLTPAQQAKLLRVMDDGMVRSVGSREARQVSVCFVAATNQDPAGMLSRGTLRRDFFYRLRGVEITLPPLRSRVEDIPLLAHQFLIHTGVRLDPTALEVLRSQLWPGNVRELRGVLLAAASRGCHGIVRRQDLKLSAQDSCLSGELPGVPGDAGLGLRGAEMRMIVEALKATHGNCSRASRLLGIHRATLRRKLREHGIDPQNL